MKKIYFLLITLILFICGRSQDSAAYKWTATSKRIQPDVYELTFSTTGNSKWQLYGANEVISEVPSVELGFEDSSIKILKPFKETGAGKKVSNPLFDNASFEIFEGPGPVSFTIPIKIGGIVPATLIGTFKYSYGRGDEFYS